MGKFVVGTLLALIVVLALVGSPVVNGQEGKVKAKADIVLVMAEQDYELQYVKEAYIRFIKHFHIGQDQTRFAVVSPCTFENGTKEDVVQDLTTAERIVEGALQPWKYPFWQVPVPGSDQMNYLITACFATEGLKAARNHLFGNGVPSSSYDRKRIIVFTTGRKENLNANPKEAKKIQDEGVLIYGIATYDNAVKFVEGLSSKDGAFNTTLIGSSRDMINTMAKVKDAIHRDLCGWKSVCAYDASKKCQHLVEIDEEKTFIINDDVIQQNDQDSTAAPVLIRKWKEGCDRFKPTSFSCQDKTQCDDQCDKEWPLKHDPKGCDTPFFCGKEIERDGDAPFLMDNCRNHKCEDCPTPPPPPPPPTQSPQEIEKMKQEEEKKMEKEIEKEKKQEEKEKKQEEKTSMMTGAIVAVLIFVLLAIAGIVIGLAVYMSKRKKIQEEQNRQLAATMENTMKQGFIQAMVPGADAALAADLDTFLQSRMSKRAPPPGASPSNKGAKSIGGKAGPSKSSVDSAKERSSGGKSGSKK